MKRHWRVSQLTLDLEQDEDDALLPSVAKRMRVSERDITSVAVVKRAFDARGRSPRFVYTLDVTLSRKARRAPRTQRGRVEPAPRRARMEPITVHRKEPVAIVGAGPAGLFAALTLAQGGLQPILIDRGKPVEARAKDIGALINRAVLNPDSNICYGEGGAGTWSDGKLTTRIGAAEIRYVLETFTEFGAPERILVDGKPHLGTDKLVKLLKSFRAALLGLDVDIRFDTCVEDLLVEGGHVVGLRLRGGETLKVPRIVFAVGHSARTLYRALHAQGIPIVAKSLAVGFRVEHPQAFVNEVQYGEFAEHPKVPTADYRLAAKADHDTRGVYSFCMCPGGQIMPTATHEDEVVTNGMSYAARQGRWANAALVVTVTPDDFAPWAQHPDDPLAGVAFQEAAERAAATLGGGAFKAPAQRVTDFLQGVPSTELRKTTYRPGVTPTDLAGLYPEAITASLKEALHDFEGSMPGFIMDDAILHAVETRTSAPLRIVRGDDMQSVGCRGLYPSGEGAGYAGGIVSAAVDGIRVARQILRELSE